MYLSKLEIQGFKSFAEKTVLEFNKELTAVVGPNGSGKSNVADAVRWVLGEQSLKLLRGKKSDDVIFAGSDKRTRLGFAEVNLYLDNTDESAPIDYREVVISRRIYRDGEGEYLINKNKVRLTDIQLLLAKASFGQRSYSIIGQGMIDSLLTSSPAERKELFDEATGVRQYQIKKDQAILKLDHSQTNLAQSEQLLSEIEPRLKSLIRQVKKLERKEELEKQLNDLQTKYYSHILNDLQTKKNTLKKSQAELQNTKNSLEEEIQQLQKNIDEEQKSDTEALAFQKLQNNYQALSDEKNRLTQELSVIKGKIDLDLTAAGKVDLVWLQNKQSELVDQIKIINQNIAQENLQLEKDQKFLSGKLEEQQKVIAEFKDIQEQLMNAQTAGNQQADISLKNIKKQLQELYNKQHEFIEALSRVKDSEDLDKLKNRATNLLEDIKTLNGQLGDDATPEGQNLWQLQEKLNEFLATKDLLVNEVQELKVKLELDKQKLDNLKNDLEKLSSEKTRIETEIKTNSIGDKNEATRLLNEQKEEKQKQIEELEKQLATLEGQLAEFSQRQEEKKGKFINLQQNLRQKQIELNIQNNKLNELNVELARLDTKHEDLENEISQEFVGRFELSTETETINIGEVSAEINRLKNQLAVIGGIDEEVIAEYKEVSERHTFLSEQTIDLKKAIEACHTLIEELDEKITQQFETAFKKINERFEHYFKILFEGGQAKLILQKKEIISKEEKEAEESEEANEITKDDKTSNQPKAGSPRAGKARQYEFGIEIQATPPGKKLKSISVLSGGEKALTSIALISAIIANNPSPFVILDEVDAALDEANSERFAKIVEELSSQTQFICITHNRATMHQAAILYGVTMKDDGVSKLLSINLGEADQLAGE